MLKIFEFFQSVYTFVAGFILFFSFAIPLGLLIVWLCAEAFKYIIKNFSIKRLFSFYGKSRRTEYWIILVPARIFSIATILAASHFGILSSVGVLLLLPSSILLTWLELSVTSRRWRDAGLLPWLLIIFCILVLLPSLSLNKDLHLIFIVIAFVLQVILGILPSAIDKENKNPLHEKMSSRT